VSRPHSMSRGDSTEPCFNPVLGFLSVSTPRHLSRGRLSRSFQSRAGFSECLDSETLLVDLLGMLFQSRAGFSECLDPLLRLHSQRLQECFNPVLGFLSVSTIQLLRVPTTWIGFNPVLGFLSVSTAVSGRLRGRRRRFQSRAGFSECLDRRATTTRQR